jgi:predicted RNase H-like HicB family nuclease
MKRFTAIVERDPETSLLVGYIPGLAGAHTQAESLDELHENLKEVLAMILEDGEPIMDSEFIGTQEVVIA